MMANGGRQHRRRQKQRAIGRRRKMNGLVGAAAAESVVTQCDLYAPAHVHASLGVGSVSAGAACVDSNRSVCSGMNVWRRSEPQCGHAVQGRPPLGNTLIGNPPGPVCSEGVRCAGVCNPPTGIWAPEQPLPSPRTTVSFSSCSLPVSMPDSNSLVQAAQQQQLYTLQSQYTGQFYSTRPSFF